MSFKLPDSSLLPSTPNSRSLRSHPSTTPAVPPPDWLQEPSTTPAVPPPRSIFGSSYPASGTFPRGTGSRLKSFTLPESSPPPSFQDDDRMHDDDNDGDAQSQPLELLAHRNGLSGSVLSNRGLSRTRLGSSRSRKESRMPAVARGIMDPNKRPRLLESDELILDTERVISTLDTAVQNLDMQDPDEATTAAVVELATIWQHNGTSEGREGTIGPPSDNPVDQASYIATFTLLLHHPYIPKPLARSRPTTAAPVPQALLSWLNIYHNPFLDDFDSIHLHQPSPSASESFWDVVFSSVLRGKLDRAVRLLKDAGWDHAVTALDDGAARPGYTGKQCDNIRSSVESCISILLSCPAVRNGNWDVKGQEWFLFRYGVHPALHELEAFAEGDKESTHHKENIFSRSTRGPQSLSSASRRAESRIPWTIYENLQTLYAHLQGSSEDIILVSQDWLEATIYLTAWWDGDDGNESLTRSAIRQGQRGATREVDITPVRAYHQKLADSFTLVTAEPQDTVFTVDTLDVAQVGLACAIEGHISSVLDILRALSLPIAAATADIAALKEWLPEGRLRSRGLLEQGFDQDDLLVLSRDSEASQGDADRDSLLSSYADLLAKRQSLQSADGQIVKQGWEMAASVLGRMSDRLLADTKITTLFDRVEIKDDLEAAKIFTLCSDLGLIDQARRLSERYADGIADSSRRYGAMLIFYARAHALNKITSVLALLTSLCLAQSISMPPQNLLDDKLASLLSAERPGIADLSKTDIEAATDMTIRLSGYATLRKFYELRDQDLNSTTSTKRKSLDRKKQAAKCLLAAITSASDCIRGGLFDIAVHSIIPIESLLVLLGEALPLCGYEVWSQGQIFTLLRVIEDFSATPARTRQAAEEFLMTCLSSNSPITLQKSQSDASSSAALGSSGYDLLTTSSLILQQPDEQAMPIARAWDWRSGLSNLNATDVNAQSLLLLLRVALANELARNSFGKYP